MMMRPNRARPERSDGMSRAIMATLWAILAVSVAAGTGGCATLTLATLGTLAGAAGSAISTGREVYGLGKLDAAEMARLDQALVATHQAADDLGLTFKPDPKAHQKDPSIVELPFVDDKGASVKVRIERRAERLVRIRVDVGWFGSEVTAHLFLTRMRTHLPPSGQESPKSSQD
jgi:hypothetical protein